MSRVVISTLRAALAAALVWTAARGADDKPAPASPATPPDENSIAGAKREFDTIKSARELELGKNGALPRISVPDLHSTPGSPGPVGTGMASKPSGAEKKSANWLLEAMEKKPEARKDRGTGRSDPETIRETRDAELEPGAERGKSDEADRRDEQDRKVASGAVNPFTRFLGEWMTPQDYALLKPGLEKSQVGGAGPQSNALPSPFGTPVTTILPGNDAAFGLGQAASVTPPSAEPRVNPYLQSLNLTPPALAVALPPAVVAPPVTSAGGPLAPAIGPSQLPPAKSRIPEFAKPATDEKYFKQLKRF